MSGSELQQTIIDRGIETPVIVVSGHVSIEDVSDAMNRGARHFLKKPTNPVELIDRVSECIAEDSELMARKRLLEVRAAMRQRLSHSEQHVFDLIADKGLSTESIAKRLGTTLESMAVDTATIFDKLGFHSSIHLVRVVLGVDPVPDLQIASEQ